MRRPAVLLVAFLIGVLALHASLAFFVHPAADDFCYASKARGLSVWAWSVGEYHDWNGRYASNLLMWRNPLSWSADFLIGYRTVPVVLFMLSVLAYRAVVRACTAGALRTGEEWCGALALSALFVNGMPAIGEGFYWYTGAVTYQLANILAALLVVSLIAFTRKQYYRTKALHLLWNAVLVLVIAGMDEQHLVLLGAGLALWCITAWRRGTSAPWPLLGIIVVAGLFVLLAPGNAVRSGYFEHTHQLLYSVGMTGIQTARFLASWLLSPALLAVSLLYLHAHLHLRDRVPAFARGFGLAPFTAVALGVGVVALCIFPAYWSMGMLAQHRTLNVAYWIVLPLWFAGLSAVLERPALRGRLHAMPSAYIRIAVLLCGLALFATGNGSQALADLFTGRAARYDSAMRARYERFTPGKDIVLRPLQDPPRTLAPFEEGRPDQHWMSECEARYFQVDEQRVRMGD